MPNRASSGGTPPSTIPADIRTSATCEGGPPLPPPPTATPPDYSEPDPHPHAASLMHPPPPATGDRAHRELLMSRNPELAHHEHVQRRVQRGGYLIGHRHPAPRQTQHHDIVTAPVMLQKTGQHSAGVAAITENTLGHGPHRRPHRVTPRRGGPLQRCRRRTPDLLFLRPYALLPQSIHPARKGPRLRSIGRPAARAAPTRNTATTTHHAARQEDRLVATGRSHQRPA